MTRIAVYTENHKSTPHPDSKITVDVDEPGSVYLDLCHLEAETVTAADLLPEEARALAAVLVAQAEAAER